MALDTYYQDHWREIEPERMSRYESMFQWRDGHEPLIAPAGIDAGQTVVDYGCGPGALVVELARRVGSNGRVIGLDINADFLEKTRALADASGFGERIDTRQIAGDNIPLDDASVDRVVCKNVLEYVPDPQATISEFRRILRPGGIGHVTDSDWGALLMEPLGDVLDQIMAGAAVAFKTPLIGRKLYGMFVTAGFTDVRVQILASADTSGGMAPVLRNMASYARMSGRIDDAVIDQFLSGLDDAIASGTFLAALPQFLVTGRAPAS